MLDPLDAKIHIRKYVSGQLNNNVVQIALKCDFGVTEDSERTYTEAGDSEDGFSSDLDQAGLTTIMKASTGATQSSPLEGAVPLHHSTLAEVNTDVVVINDTGGVGGVVEPEVAPAQVSELPSLTEVAPPLSTTPNNPKKKIKLEVDRDVARNLAASLNSFASMLQINNDSSDDSFEVLPESE